MAEEIYNPTIHIREKIKDPLEEFRKKRDEEQKFSENLKKLSEGGIQEQQMKIDVQKKELAKREKELGKTITKSKSKLPRATFRKVTAGILGYKRTSRPLKDRVKVLRLQNMLERKRLQNEIDRLKLQKKVENLRKRGKLQQVISLPFIKPKQLAYPAYATPATMGDIDSAFFADINHADKSLWGGEEYYDENFYAEDYYGKEFDNDPFFHLQIKPKQGVSPLLW